MTYDMFWFVWSPEGYPPKFRHASPDLAEQEARRLALLNPGKEFIVLRSEKSFKAEQPVTEVNHEWIPF